jgi:NAD(P)-dependent dehydrogenase (short-subunit alcohol dehydrogenase family)
MIAGKARRQDRECQLDLGPLRTRQSDCYTSAKAGVINLTRSLAIQLAAL